MSPFGLLAACPSFLAAAHFGSCPPLRLKDSRCPVSPCNSMATLIASRRATSQSFGLQATYLIPQLCDSALEIGQCDRNDGRRGGRFRFWPFRSMLTRPSAAARLRRVPAANPSPTAIRRCCCHRIRFHGYLASAGFFFQENPLHFCFVANLFEIC